MTSIFDTDEIDDDDDSEIPEDAVRTVITFRGNNNRPVVVPEEVVLEADRVYRCHQLRLSGLGWDEIARKEGYPNATAVHAAVSRYLAEARDLVQMDRAKDMLREEVMRLDYMQSRLWRLVELGDPKAIDTVLKIMTKRVEWQNLAVDPKQTSPDTLHTVVIAGEDYTAYLRRIAEESEPPAISGNVVTNTEEGP